MQWIHGFAVGCTDQESEVQQQQQQQDVECDCKDALCQG